MSLCSYNPASPIYALLVYKEENTYYLAFDVITTVLFTKRPCLISILTCLQLRNGTLIMLPIRN